MKSTETILREYRAKQEETPAERWRKPVIPVAVENDPDVLRFDGKHWRHDVNATFDEETIERFRQGYACLHCWEPQRSPWPKNCSLCGYEMAVRQQADFAEMHEGEKWIGPTTSLHDELERLDETGARKRHQPGSSILLPGRDF